jgi:hypothetical protein
MELVNCIGRSVVLVRALERIATALERLADASDTRAPVREAPRGPAVDDEG